jgi:threonine dehydrogenase-like Zn-dependent dehydrogenase
MNKTMKALVMRSLNDVAILERPIPTAGPNDAVIKTTIAMVCTSDVHTVSGGLGDISDRILGHEAVGVIHELGSAVKGFKIGDRVAVNAITPCYKCENCQRGFTSQCGTMLGGYKFTIQKDGSMAEYFHLNDAEANLALIPDEVSDEAACYTTDMMSTGFKGAENARIPLGGSGVIFGMGPVGLMAVAGTRMLGAGLVIAVDCVPSRLELAKFYGADITINFKEKDPITEILRLTNGQGTDAAMDALGTQSTFENCVKAARPGGIISNIGYFSHGDYINIPRLDWGVGMAEKTITTLLCPGGSERMKRLLRLIQNGRIDPTRLTTHHFSFSEVHKALDMMTTKADGIIKPVIHFN